MPTTRTHLIVAAILILIVSAAYSQVPKSAGTTGAALEPPPTLTPYGEERYQEVKVNCAETLGPIKNLMGLQGGPKPDVPGTPDLSEHYRALGVNMVRLPQDNRDTLFLGHVFPNDQADPLDPASYQFGEFDEYAKAIRSVGAEYLWEAQYLIGEKGLFRPEFIQKAKATGIPHLKIVPTAEIEKWATVCVQVLRHLNDGWANGHHLGVSTVEFINEPFMGPPDIIYKRDEPTPVWECYAAFARAIRAYNPNIKIFAPSLTDIDMRFEKVDLLNSFLDYVAEQNVPLDYFSWHAYIVEPQDFFAVAKRIGDALDRHGDRLAHVRVANTEWDYGRGRITQGTHAAHNTTTLIYFQDAPRMDYGIRYRADHRHDWPTDSTSRVAVFGYNGKPNRAYYGFLAMSRQRKETPLRIAATGSDAHAFGVLAGRAEDKSAVSVVVSDMHSAYRGFELQMGNLPWGKEDEFTAEAFVVDDEHEFEKVWDKSGRGQSFAYQETRNAPYVMWVALKRK